VRAAVVVRSVLPRPSGVLHLDSDVAIYLLGLAEMTGVDLQDQIEAKIAKNAARVYRRLQNGVLAKSTSEADTPI
jgi:hypothetical protein